jgi:nicotinate-nucleotide pyrophosphorylase (carboxylating)
VQTVEQARTGLEAQVYRIMLDIMPPADVAQVVHLRETLVPGAGIALEASGTITVAQAQTVAATGVDAISVGAVTHSAPAVDLSMVLTGSELCRQGAGA